MRTRNRKTLTAAALISLGGVATWIALAGLPVPDVTGTLTDTIDDTNGTIAGVAEPGETIDYTATITNSGAAAENSVTYDTDVDGNTTLVPGSVATTPLARDDAYSSYGNVGISVSAPGPLGNDFDQGPQAVAVVAASGTTGQGGTFTINSNGSFDYLPPAGFNGQDSFSYTILDENGAVLPAPATGSNTATVTLTVTGMIWFIDDTAPPGGDGSLTNPFDSLGDQNGNPNNAVGDAVFIFSGSYPGGLTPLNSQHIVGQGASQPIETILGITLPTNSNSLPPTGGTAPVLTNTSGNGIDLAQGNTIRGLDIGGTSGAGIAGSSVGTFTASEVTISDGGTGIDIDGGTLAASFDSISATSSGAPGIELTNVNGSFSVSGGTISATGQRGINIVGNPSLAIGGNLTSVSSSGADRGISLLDTTGGLTISGTGSGARDGSGGTITASEDGIFVNRSDGNVFQSINISNTGRHGVKAGGTGGIDGLDSITLRGLTISSAGDGVGEDGIEFRDVTGVVVIDDCSVTGSAEHGVEYFNDSGSILELTVSDNVFSDHTSGTGFNFELQSTGAANLFMATCTGNTVENNFATGFLFANNSSGIMNGLVVGDAGDTTNNSINDNNLGINISAGPASNQVNAKVVNNSASRHESHGINLFSANSAGNTINNVYNVHVTGNDIGTLGVDDSGSAIGNGLRVNMNDPVDAAVLVDNNNIHGIGEPNAPSTLTEFGRAIEVQGRLGAGTTDITITNNSLEADGGHGLFVAADSGEVGGDHTVTTNITGNTCDGGRIVDFDGDFSMLLGFLSGQGGDIVLQEIQDASPGSGTLRLENPGGETSAVAHLIDDNTIVNSSTLSSTPTPHAFEIDDSGVYQASNVNLVSAGTTQLPPP